MQKIILCAVVLMAGPVLARAATCDAGQYLLNGECIACAALSYCPGDDVAYACNSLYTGGLFVYTDFSMVTDATTPDGCICAFDVKTPDSEIMTQSIWRGKCADGPTEFYAVREIFCRAGYYATSRVSSRFDFYERCAPCTNEKPDNAVYSDRGQANSDFCPWKCADGYKVNTDGTACDKLCTLGYTTLNTSTGVTVPLYADKRTTPSINIGDVNGACHADLATGRATGAINVMYNGTIYHTISPTTMLQCDAGYWLDDDDVCAICTSGYYCPGDNTRISCETAILEEDGIPRPSVYTDSTTSGFKNSSRCLCRWDNLSDERRAKYTVINECYLGVQNEKTYLNYDWCRVGYYAIRPKNFGNWYYDCAACYNGPPNSHYTSYSTPSMMYAVESNCPWECDAGYVRDGDVCVSE